MTKYKSIKEELSFTDMKSYKAVEMGATKTQPIVIGVTKMLPILIGTTLQHYPPGKQF